MADNQQKQPPLDDREVVAHITWMVADIRQALKDSGYADSDDNVRRVLNNRFEKTVQDLSIGEGWGIISTIIENTDGLTE